jgi:hypothetical protein
MLRRTIALALAGLAVAAPPALASPHWNSQFKNGTATASRDAGGCSFRHGSRAGSLLVTCAPNHQASLVYVFPTRHTAQGRPSYGVSATGWGRLYGSAKVAGDSIRLTLTVGSHSSVDLNTVHVSYYTCH